MFGVGKYKIGIAVLFIALVIMPIALAQATTQEVYDITDRQTRDLKTYIDNKISTTTDSLSKLQDTLFQTFDQRMQDLTKSFAIQSAVMMFFAILLGNAIAILIRQKHEKKLMEYRYNNILAKEIELNRKLEASNVALKEDLARTKSYAARPYLTTPQENIQEPPVSQPRAASSPVGYGPEPQPIPASQPEKPKRFLGIFGPRSKPSEQQLKDQQLSKDIEKALKGVR
jgi:hypothetical protein